MEILVFGGTVFLSRAMAELAVARGHNVTTFNRGQSGPPVAGAVDRVTGDRGRPEDLEQLRGRHFDLVFDTAYLPEHARLAADLLEPGAAHYVYISSINAFPGWPDQADYRAGGVYDGDPDAVGDQVPNDLPDPEGSGPYGWRKVGCERSILRRFGEHRTSILRAGLIVGPKDRAGRLPWWLDRVARARAGESVLAPGEPDAEVRLIDCRDVAEFALRRPVGTFEISGPRRQITRRQLLDEIAEITRAQPEFVWIPDEALAGRVQMWTKCRCGCRSPNARGFSITTPRRRRRPVWPCDRCATRSSIPGSGCVRSKEAGHDQSGRRASIRLRNPSSSKTGSPPTDPSAASQFVRKARVRASRRPYMCGP